MLACWPPGSFRSAPSFSQLAPGAVGRGGDAGTCLLPSALGLCVSAAPLLGYA